MDYPALEVLLEKVDCKYTLVVLAAKRARELKEGSTCLVNPKSSKIVTIALEEIAQGKISYQRQKVGIK